MTDEYIEAQRIQTTDDIVQLTPGATFIRFNKTQPEYNIRGINANAEGSALEASAVTVIDNIPISKDILKNPAMFDTERVEVLRGPQGTSFGRNATAGLVHILTKRPIFDREGGLTVGGGTHGLFEADGYISGALSDHLAARLAFNFDTYDGFTEDALGGDGLDGQENAAVRGSLLYEIEELSVYVKAEYSEDDDETPVRRFRNCDVPQLVAADDPALRAELGLGPDHPPWPVTFFDPCDVWETRISDGDFFLNREIFNVTGEIVWRAANGMTITSETGYIDGETDHHQEAHGTPENVLFQRGIQDAEIFTQEVRIDNHASGRPLRWLAGVFYLHDEHDKFDENQFFQQGAAGRPDTRDTKVSTNETDSIGVFGELSLDVSDEVNVTLGARWNRDEKDYEIAHTGFGWGGPISQLQGCVFFPPGGQFICGDADNPVGFADPVSVSDDWDDLMFKGSIQYNVTPDHMVYALVSQGYKAGGFQPEPPNIQVAQQSIDEETVTNYEIGWKGALANRIQFSINGYYEQYNDLQLSQFIDTGSGFFQAIGNASDA